MSLSNNFDNHKKFYFMLSFLNKVFVPIHENYNYYFNNYINLNNILKANDGLQNYKLRNLKFISDEVYEDDGEVVFEAVRYKNFIVHNYQKYVNFLVHIYSRKKFIDDIQISKKEFMSYLFKKSGVDADIKIDYSKFKDYLPITKFSKYCNNFSELKENYNSIVNDIISNISLKDDLDYCADYFFNKSNLYYRDLIKIFCDSLDYIYKQKGFVLNYKIMYHIFSSTLFYKSDDNFGIVYQTTKYIASKLKMNKETVLTTMRKLEFLGVLDNIVGDTSFQKCNVNDYLKNLDNATDMEICHHYKEMYKDKFEKKNGAMLFPAVNFRMLLAYIDEKSIKEVVQNFYDKLIVQVTTMKMNEMLSRINNLSEETIRLYINKYIKNKKMINQGSINLYDIYNQSFNGYIKNINKMNEFPDIDTKKDFNKFFDNKKGGLGYKNLIEDTYLISSWIRGTLLNYNTFFTKNKSCIKKNFKKYFDESKFSYFLNNQTELVDFNSNCSARFSDLVLDFYKGIWDFIHYGNGNRTYLSQYKIKNLAFNKSKTNYNIFYLRGIKGKLNKIIDKYGLDKSYIYQNDFSLFELIKQLYFKADHKLDFILMIYDTFYNSNKSLRIVFCKLETKLIRYLLGI
jgi:hypothetical protein